MANNSDLIRIYGDDDQVYVAPKGTTGPVDLVTAPAAAFEAAGWLGEGGIELDHSIDTKEYKALQGGATVRRKGTGGEFTQKFSALEENAVVLELFLKGVTPTSGGTGAAAYDKYAVTVANQCVEDVRAWVFDLVDGTYRKRLVVPAGWCEAGAITHKNDEMTVYEFTVHFSAYDLYVTKIA